MPIKPFHDNAILYLVYFTYNMMNWKENWKEKKKNVEQIYISSEYTIRYFHKMH